MAVPEQIPVVNYVADGIVKKFDVPFEYDQQSDLHVYVDGVEPTIDKYYFDGNAFNFYIAPTSGQDVKIKRITPKERDTDYNLHTNTVRPKALNTDFDRLWYVLQEVFSDVGGLSQAVQDEIIARIQGDEDLLNQLTAEISARMLGDEAVTDDLKNYVDNMIALIIGDPSFNGINADKVNDASGETQQQVNYNGGSKWHSRVGGYKLNERVILTNGDIVKSTIDGNTNDPNVDMTGWFNTKQSYVGEKSVSLWGGSVVSTLDNFDAVNLDKDEILTAPVLLQSGKQLTSNRSTLNQTTPTTIVIESGYSVADTIISGLYVIQDKTGPISGGTNNNHASIKYQGGLRNILRDIKIDGQLGVSFGTGAIGSPDRRSMYNSAENITMLNTHMGIEHIGASYNHTRNIVVAPTEFKGIFHGIRLTGYDQIENPSETAHAPCHGNTGSDYFIKNMSNGISAQNSAKYNSYDRVFVTECDRAVQILQGTVVGNNPTMNHFDVIGEKVGQAIVNQGGNHNDFELLIDGSAFTDQGIQELTGYSGKGFNRYRGIIKNSTKTGAQFRYSHNLYALQVSSANGNGVNINGSFGNGALTVNGANGAGVSLAGNYNSLQIVATECITALSVSGAGNTLNIVTDGNVIINGDNNVITGYIGGTLSGSGVGNRVVGEVIGSVALSGLNNNLKQIKGFSGNEQQSITTNASGAITVALSNRNASASVRYCSVEILNNTDDLRAVIKSISGANVAIKLVSKTGADLTAITNATLMLNWSN